MEQQLQINLLLLQHRQSYGCIDWCVWQPSQEQNAHLETSGIFPIICEEGMEDQIDEQQVFSALGETLVTISVAE